MGLLYSTRMSVRWRVRSKSVFPLLPPPKEVSITARIRGIRAHARNKKNTARKQGFLWSKYLDLHAYNYVNISYSRQNWSEHKFGSCQAKIGQKVVIQFLFHLQLYSEKCVPVSSSFKVRDDDLSSKLLCTFKIILIKITRK